MQTGLLIDGELVEGAGEKLTVLDPATGEGIVKVAGTSPEQVEAAVRTSAEAFESFSLPTPAERGALLLRMDRSKIAAKPDRLRVEPAGGLTAASPLRPGLF